MQPRRWYAYFQAIMETEKGIVLLEVTEDAFRQIRELTLINDNIFRGLKIRMHRRGTKRNAPIQVDLVEIFRGVKAIPESIDIWPMILKLFKLK